MFYVICLLIYYRDSRPSVWHKKYYYATVVHEYIARSSVTLTEVREAIVYSTVANGLEQTLSWLTLITLLTDVSLKRYLSFSMQRVPQKWLNEI